MNKKYLVTTVIIGVMILLVACQKEESQKEKYQYTFRLAESHPSDFPTTRADYEFARRVEEESDGRIHIVVYDSNQLGEERSVIEQVQFGGIDFTRVSIGTLAEFATDLNVLQMPYLYKNSDHMWKVLDGKIGDRFLKGVEEDGFYGLAWFEAGARSFYNSKKPIETMDDLKDMRIRVMESSLLLNMVESLGATGVMMPYGDVYEALQLGTIDGAENNYPSYETSNHYEIAKYYTIDEHVRIPEMLIASKKAMEGMSEEDMAMIRRIAKETESYQRRLWEADQAASEQFLTEHGVVINRIDDITPFVEAMQPLYASYGEDYGELIDRIQAIGDEMD